MTFDKRTESRIYTIAFLSLMGPPIGWIVIILISELLSFQDLIAILINPFFYLYIILFLAVNIFINRRMIQLIKINMTNEEYGAVNAIINKVPFGFFLYTAIYGILGPPTVTIGVALSEYQYFMVWILGPIVISTFSIPFFNYYLTTVYSYTKEVPLNKSSIFSLSKRLNISIIYLVLGVLMMIAVVFYNIFYLHLNEEAITLGQLRTKLLIFLALSIIIIGIPLFIVNAEFRSNLLKVSRYLQDFRDGKLGVDLATSQRDEMGFLIDDARSLSFHFNEIISNLKESVLTLSQLGTEISDTSDFIASGGDLQRKNGKELTRELHLLLSETSTNSNTADKLSKEAIQMREEIHEGRDELNSLFDSINTISKNLKNINEISQQTNMLALNATVEASNAGEHGKGFGVIAGEVRKLADRSNSVATNINKLIKEIIGLAENSTNKFQHFSEVVENNAEMCQTIKHSSNEQQKVIDSITSRMDQFNEKISQLASHAEKMESNATQLKNLSTDLKSASDYFRTSA